MRMHAWLHSCEKGGCTPVCDCYAFMHNAFCCHLRKGACTQAPVYHGVLEGADWRGRFLHQYCQCQKNVKLNLRHMERRLWKRPAQDLHDRECADWNYRSTPGTSINIGSVFHYRHIVIGPRTPPHSDTRGGRMSRGAEACFLERRKASVVCILVFFYRKYPSMPQISDYLFVSVCPHRHARTIGIEQRSGETFLELHVSPVTHAHSRNIISTRTDVDWYMPAG